MPAAQENLPEIPPSEASMAADIQRTIQEIDDN
jgi:hypothetical protein